MHCQVVYTITGMKCYIFGQVVLTIQGLGLGLLCLAPLSTWTRDKIVYWEFRNVFLDKSLRNWNLFWVDTNIITECSMVWTWVIVYGSILKQLHKGFVFFSTFKYMCYPPNVRSLNSYYSKLILASSSINIPSKTMFGSSLLPIVVEWSCFIYDIYVFWCTTRFPYQIMFNSNTTG
jgi:hypothetical protein